MQSITSNREQLFKYLIYAIGIITFLYATFRSVVMDITHDESFTYVMCVPLSFWESVTYQEIQNANNHILNTLMMKVSIAIFGNAEWALRLPNIFGHFLYIFFSIRITKLTFSWTYLGLLAIILLNFNPYLLDFFSVARGYGLALGFMMSSIYFFFYFLNNKQLKYWVISLFLAFLAVYSNFIYLLYFVSLVGIYAIVEFERYWRSRQSFAALIKGQVASLVGTVLTAAVIAVPLLKLRALKEFRYGGSVSFYQDTYGRLLKYSMYDNNYFGPGTFKFLSVFIFILLVSSSLLIIVQHLKSKRLILENSRLLLLLFGGFLVTISIVQHHVLGAAYLTDRRSLIFLPFAALALSCGLFELDKYSKGIARFLALMIAVFSLFHFSYNARDYLATKEWYFDRDTREVLSIMKREADAMNKTSVKLEVNGDMKNGVNFYQKSQNLEWLQRIRYLTRDVKGNGADFYYIYDYERATVTDQVDTLFQNKGRILLRSISSE